MSPPALNTVNPFLYQLPLPFRSILKNPVDGSMVSRYVQKAIGSLPKNKSLVNSLTVRSNLILEDNQKAVAK